MKKIQGNRHVNIIVFSLTAVLISAVLLVGMFFTYRTTTDKAITQISEIYLSELSGQMISHFSTSLSSQFAQIMTIMDSAKAEDFESLENLQHFLQQQKENNDFPYVALLTQDGICYTDTQVYPAISKIHSLNALLQGGERIISANETILGDNMLLIGVPIHTKMFGDKQVIAALVGMDIPTLNRKIMVQKSDAAAYSSVISDYGAFIMHTNSWPDALESTNLFHALDIHAEFAPQDSLDAMQSCIMEQKKGMSVIMLQGKQQYLYYAPIPDTDWTMCIIMPYAGFDMQIKDLSTVMARTAFVVVIVICLLVLSFAYMNIKITQEDAILLTEQKNRAEQANLAKSEFLSRMSHEIRTPMNGIIGMTAIAMRNIHDPRRAMQYLEKVNLSSQHLLSLINDVLDMSKIESGKIEIQHELFSFKQLLDALSTVYYTQALTKKQNFKIIILNDIHEELIGDALRINQVLTNLLSNAMKFTPADGDITVLVEESDMENGHVWMRITVADTGCGIAQENQDKIFHAFEQESNSIAQQYGGTGLGLPISLRFSQLMGGSLTLTSNRGHGSAFTVSLPLGIPAQQAVSEPIYQNQNVLVVDPIKQSGQHTCVLLQKLGASATWCGSQKLALDMFTQGGAFDLCVIAWKLPDTNGVQLACEISQIAPQPPKILLTAYNGAEIQLETEKTHIVSVLYEPLFASSFVKAWDLLQSQTVDIAIEHTMPITGAFADKTILIVEDNDINLEIAMDFVAMTNANILTARNGLQAVEVFSRSELNQIDLILMDVQMPIMDGCEATVKIRELTRADAKIVPILAMTASAFKEDIKRCQDSGMNEHISKPIDMAVLYEKMSAFLNTNKEQQTDA